MKKSIIALCLICFSLLLVAKAEAISFVQVSAAAPQTPQSIVSVTYNSAQTAGNLNVVAVGWNDSTATVTSVTDTRGNVYQLAVGPTTQAGVASQAIYYAKNIAAAPAGGNSVTVNFSVAARFPDIRILEYNGLDPVNPVDVVKAATGTNSTSNSGAVTTTNPNDLLFAANLVQTSTRAAGTSFTSRIITSPDGDIAEDRIVSAVGSYSATASLTSAGAWIMQMVAFKAASAAPDLAISKTHTGNFIQGQTGAIYTITATNIGSTPTTGTVTVSDSLPSGLTATALSGTGWTCTLANLTCTRSDALAASGSYPAITLTVNVASNAPASVTNTATVSGGGDTNTANNTANDPTTINPAGTPDLAITKTHSGNFTQGQTGATYSLTVRNAGTASTSGTVTVVDTLPTGLTATAISGTGWTCTLANLTCTRSDALAASGSYPAITLTVNVASNAPASVTNTATVSGGGDANTANNTANDPTTINPAGTPDLSMSKTHSGNFTQGQTGATYTLTVTNVGTAATSGTVTVTDTLPSGLTATGLSGTGWTCTLASLTCTRSDSLAASGSYPTITLTVNVGANAPTSVTNAAAVSGGGDTNAANNTANNPTTINPAGTPDLTISKTHTGNFTQGQTGATYTLTVSNVGAAATSGTVTVTDTLPAGLTATGLTGTGWTCTLANLTCTRSDSLAASGIYPAITLTVNVASNATASVTNTAAVSGGGDTNAANNTANDPTTIGTPVTGLVAAYSFNEGAGTTTADASGNGNNGTIANATWATSGKYGNALVFNGTNALVTINDSTSLHLTTAMTLEAWVNPSAVSSTWRDVIYKGNDNYFLEGTSSAGSVPASGGTFGGAGSEVYGTAALSVNTWTHLAMTYDGTTMRLYVNGAQVASKAQTGPITTSTNPLQIGGDSLFGQYFQGMIDEVRVYNVALTLAQIQADMNTPVAQDSQPPTAPSNLMATAISGAEIDLTWTAATDNIGVTGYLIERCQGAGCTNFAQIGTIAGTAYPDVGLAGSTTYVYQVRAIDAAGNQGPYSNSSSATTLAPDTEPPTAPSNLVATAVSGTQINLAWTPATDNVGVTGYRVERCQGGGCEANPANFVKLAYPTGPAYSDTGLSPNTSYSYVVRATDAAQNLGPYSNVAIAVTLATNPNLVAAYSFDEGTGTTVSDISGNGNTGTLANTTWTSSGKFGSALVFNGTNAFVTINDSASLHLTSAMTLEAWVNPSATNSAWRDVIYKGDDIYYLEATSSSGGVPAGGGTFAPVPIYGTATLPVNAWSHLALTYEGTALRFYLNGVQVSTLVQTGPIQTSTNPLQIGGDSIYGQYFQGSIDEVRVYNVALTPAQIQTDMNTPINATPDTQPPTAPGNLTATAVGGSQINLAWSASTDNVVVAGYLVERCQGAGCTNFAQVGTASITTFNDTGLTGNSIYRYQVRAIDGAGNLSPYSNVAQATTGFSVSPGVAVLTFSRTQQFTASVSGVTWSVDGVVGGSTSFGTITAGGLYTPPSAVGAHMVTASSGSQSATATIFITNYPGTFTHHNDNSRTGQNLNETVLTPANVNSLQFGKLFSYPLDGKAYASPLYVANLNIPGKGFHNVVYVATEHDSVYAFDADGLSAAPLWQVSFINPAAGITTVPANDTGECCDIAPEIGITGTPVLDPGSGTLYLVAKTKEVSGGNTNYVQRLHALDITTGVEKFGGPVVLQATVPGSGMGSSGGQLSFLPLRENQRPALLLSNGAIYIGFSSHGDNQPYHGWVLAYNATTLQQNWAFCVTANGEGAGVWMSGAGFPADSNGNIYYVTGDGTFDANSGGSSYGDSFVRMSPSGTVLDYFTPHIQADLNAGNIDLGSGGLLLLPDQPGTHPHLMLSAGKDGTIYLVDRDNMGHYNPNNDNQIVQSLVNIFPFGTPEPGNYSAPVYYNGTVYFIPITDNVQAFQLNNGLLPTAPTSRSSEIYTYPGGTMAISANGTNNGLLWVVQRHGTDPTGGGTVAPGVLRAYDPANLSFELYNSDQAGTRDTMDYAAKFNVPLVANGRVFVAGENQLTVYGLLP